MKQRKIKKTELPPENKPKLSKYAAKKRNRHSEAI